ncbi:unnamed protein product [Candidula unifasciata]|uniref:Uncharacterized protein n=1 Tax=Candidula unifasciata TaxID=100452 RepID=A0A8S3Z4L3_9EUPU|nr:unnamed protein product [Candidula unifasciata]
MPNSPPPPTYEEAVLSSVDPHLRQNHTTHKKTHSPTRQTADNPADAPKLGLSFQTSIHPLLTYTQADGTSHSCVLDIPLDTDLTTESDSQNYMNAPAIIIHSAISTPGDDESNYFDKFNSNSKNSLVKEQQTAQSEKQNQKSPSFSTSNQETGNFTNADIELNIFDRTKKDKNGAGVSYETITKDHSSVIHSSDGRDCKRGITEACVECRKANGVNRKSSVTSDIARFRNANTEIICISKNGTRPPRYYSQDSLIKRPHQPGCLPQNELSNSVDEEWCQMDRIHADSFSSARSMRQRSGTLDYTSAPFKQQFKQSSERTSSTFVIMPARSNFSKSYTDLSSRHQVAYHRESYCGRNIYKCPRCHSSSSTRDSRCQIAAKPHKQHNLSSSRINRSVEENRISKIHLLPEARNGHGTRGIRSVSVGDVRMRDGTDDYEWKDGKVQLKNGKISHGESVRYVWKDGHVEKITSDANNEDTQVEILEASDSKTCSKINPVFVCVFLLAVIAVVIIIPVYFSS